MLDDHYYYKLFKKYLFKYKSFERLCLDQLFLLILDLIIIFDLKS